LRKGALKAQPGKSISINGSNMLVQTVAQHDLVDEERLMVYLVVLGSSKQRFAERVRLNLRLIESRAFPSGVVLLRYARERVAKGESTEGHATA
jgi:dihydrofolate reductase